MGNGEDDGYMVTFERPAVPGLRLAIASAAGTRAAMRRMWDDEFFERGAVRFVIADAGGYYLLPSGPTGPSSGETRLSSDFLVTLRNGGLRRLGENPRFY